MQSTTFSPKPIVDFNQTSQKCPFCAPLPKPFIMLLYATGILDFDDDEEDDENDEILRELRQKQAELREICAHNLQATKRLYKVAREEMDKQELKRKLAASDAEVGSSY